MAIELVNWLEIPVENMKRARNFYEAIFDTQLVDFELDQQIYPCFPNREKEGFSGALVQYDFARPGKQGPLVYLNASPSLESMIKRIKTAGGTVIKDKTEIAPGFGFYALFEDTEGNMLALQGAE